MRSTIAGRAAAVAAILALLIPSLVPATVGQPLAAAESLPAKRMIVGFADSEKPPHGETFLGAQIVRRLPQINAIAVQTVEESTFRASAAASPGVRYVEEDSTYTVASAFVPSDPLWSDQWSPKQVRVDQAWLTTRGDASAAVCVIDTGIKAGHEDLSQAPLLGWQDFVDGSTTPVDPHGHGTHVTGTALAPIDNAIGVAGMANAGVYAVRVLNADGIGDWSVLAEAITWCADHTVGPTVISLSLGGTGYSQAVQDAVRYAADAGKLIVAAAGNGRCLNCIIYPAAYEEVIAVTCTNRYEEVCWFSSTGPQAELSAPGQDILSTTGSGYQNMSGTSMSTPHVSGAAALYWSHHPNISAADLRARLARTAQDLGPPGRDTQFGVGELDVLCLFYNESACSPPPVVRPPPPTNDLRADAEPLPLRAASLEATTVGAYLEPDEYRGCPTWYGDGSMTGTLWYAYEPTESGLVTLNTSGSPIRTVLAAHRVVDGSQLISCARGANGSGASVSWLATAGERYEIQVSGSSGEEGEVHLHLLQTACPGPANDCFDASAFVPPGESVAGTTLGSTREFAEPTECGSRDGSVWYTTRMNESRYLTPKLTANFRASLAVFAGEWPNLQVLNCGGRTMHVENGTTLHFQVSGACCLVGSDYAGDYELSLPLDCLGPINDCAANATAFPDSLHLQVDSRSATTEPAEPFCSYSGASLWYTYEPPRDGRLLLSTVGSSMVAGVAVYNGTPLHDLDLVGCEYDLFYKTQALVDVPVKGGTTYYIQTLGAGDLVVNGCTGEGDDCAARGTWQSEYPVSQTIPLWNATWEGSEPQSLCASPTATRWQRLRHPGGDLNVSLAGGGDDLSLSFFEGTWGDLNLATLPFVTCASGTAPAFTFQKGPSPYYHLQIGGRGDLGNASLEIHHCPGPRADCARNAITIQGDIYNASLDTTGATDEPIDDVGMWCPTGPQSFVGLGVKSAVWHRIEMSRTTHVRVALSNSTFGPELMVLKGTHDRMEPVACIPEWDSDPGRDNATTFLASAGVTYWIKVGDRGGAQGQTKLTVETGCPYLRNDCLFEASPLQEPHERFHASTLEATHEAEKQTCGGIGATLWYSYVPTTSGRILFDTRGSSFDTVVAAFQRIGDAFYHHGCVDDPAEGESAARIALDVTAGAAYYFQAGGRDAARGDLAIAFTHLCLKPQNDCVSSAAELEANTTSRVHGTTVGTTRFEEPSGCGDDAATVWYRYVSPRAQVLRLSLDGEEHRLAVFSADGGGALSPLACGASDATTAPLHVSLAEAATVYVRVSHAGAGGSFDLMLDEAPYVELYCAPSPSARYEDVHCAATNRGDEAADIQLEWGDDTPPVVQALESGARWNISHRWMQTGEHVLNVRSAWVSNPDIYSESRPRHLVAPCPLKYSDRMLAGLGGLAVDGVSSVDLAVSPYCRNQSFDLTVQQPFNADVCWLTAASVEIRCDRSGFSERGEIPIEAQVARIILVAGVKAYVTLHIVDRPPDEPAEAEADARPDPEAPPP